MSISAGNGSRPGNESYSRWLKEGPILSFGARAFLMHRWGTAERPRTPWIPITLFGFALDEDGPKTVAPQLDEEPGRCAPGDAI